MEVPERFREHTPLAIRATAGHVLSRWVKNTFLFFFFKEKIYIYIIYIVVFLYVFVCAFDV